MGAFLHRCQKLLPPPGKRKSGQVPSLPHEDIKDDIGNRHPALTRASSLQPQKKGLHVRLHTAHHHDLPVEDGAGCQDEEFLKFRELFGEFRVVPAPDGEGFSHISNCPHTVPLDLEQPVLTTERDGGSSGKHREVAGFHAVTSGRAWR